jgi:2-oxoglutarate dehydrogenase E1 component
MLKQTPKAELVWCQEEPKNMGSWTFVRDYLEAVMEAVGMPANRPIYAGRKEAASPATGSASRHRAEQEALVNGALSIGKASIAAE